MYKKGEYTSMLIKPDVLARLRETCTKNKTYSEYIAELLDFKEEHKDRE